jgi:hypothetical protein
MARSSRQSHSFTIIIPLLLTVVFAAPASGDDADLFERYVRPLLLEKCIECHGPQKQENGIRLDRRNDVLQGTASDQPLIKPGAPEESRLFQVLQHSEEDISMPPTTKLEDTQIEYVRIWIQSGAVWPETSDLEGEARRRAERWREHWAFQPVVKPDTSAFPAGRNPVDELIGAKLSAAGLKPFATAAPQVLVRRLSFALTGLPPELSDLQAAQVAVRDGRWDAWRTEYTDRLLASPHFGERWGRYWLDTARYSDTKGYVFQEDREYSEAWRYREWVIRSLNADMPYDEFLRRQLAADRLPGSDDPAQLAAMGFLTLGRRFLNNPHDIIDDRIDLVSRGMLGLTAACARCHDHKYDPIPAADYYSLYGVFASSDEPKNEPSPLRLVDREKPVEPVIFLRGSPGNRGDPVPRRFFTALSKPETPNFTDGSGRLELANAIADSSNPLTGRVAVNRVWMHLFGRGFVDTPSDFGVRTERPIHHELMDYLTSYFVDHQWSMKSLIRHIVLSETWQQDSAPRPDAVKVDPENRLLSRMNRQRLDFEAFRDSVLMASGKLDRTIGGKSADIAADPNNPRRTVYARIDRQNLPGLFRTFDYPNPDAHAPLRFETTVPQQALYQLNNAFLMNRATDVAEAVRSTTADKEPEAAVRETFLRTLQRLPDAEELSAAAEFLRQTDNDQKTLGPLPGWSYGFGSVVDGATPTTKFSAYPWSGDGRWQGGPTLPDPKFGWASLTKTGGHPGNNPDYCSIRRWTTDVDCRVIINGAVGHANESGDGVRLRVITSDGKVLSDVVAFNQTTPLAAGTIELKAGMGIDFVADCRANTSHDSFTSKALITQIVGGSVQRVWDSEKDFRDQPSASRLDAGAQLAQTLLLTNEFLFID